MKPSPGASPKPPARGAPKIHFRKRVQSVLGYGIILTSACNRDVRPFTLFTTSDRDQVTCEQCRQSRVFKNPRTT